MKRFRQRAGLTQAALAQMAGLSARAVQDVERGLSIPRLRTVRRLVTALDLRGVDREQLEAAASPRPRRSSQSANVPVSCLPVTVTSFVGRERERLSIERLLDSTRLLTITGPGGVGKTRLALEVARVRAPFFGDGVWPIELAMLSESKLVVHAVAEACGVRERKGQPLLLTLLEWLGDKRALLVVDNCEHVLDGCAELVARIVHVCPEVTVLATSREALLVMGEVVWQLEPLSLPETAALQTPETLQQFEAPRLFVERVRAVRPQFSVTPETAPLIAELCRRLDGLPLALELAAARTRGFPVRALLQVLTSTAGGSVSLLSGGARDAHARQRSLAETLAWSYHLLTPDEQRLFARMSVFRGCTLEAVGEVCVAPRDSPGNYTVALPGLGVDAVAGTACLVDKNLLGVEEGRDGRPWYVMLETVRDFALSCLEANGEGPAVRRRHALYYLRLVEETARDSSRWPGLASDRETVLFDALEREHANCRAALDWSQAQGYAAIGFRLAIGLWWFWFTRGHAIEGRARLTSLLERFPPGGNANMAALEIRALETLARLMALQGYLADAQVSIQQALALAEQLEDGDALFSVLEGLGFVAYQRADYVAAKSAFDRSLAVARTFAGLSKIASALYNLGTLAQQTGDTAEARALLEESAVLYEDIGESRSLGFVYLALSGLARKAGEFDRSGALAEHALLLMNGCGDRRGAALALAELGTRAVHRGDFADAWRLLQQSLRVQQELDDPLGTAMALDRFAALEAARGRHVRSLHFAAAAAAIRNRVQTRLVASAQRDLNSTLEVSRRALGRATDEVWTDAPSPEEVITEALASMAERRKRRPGGNVGPLSLREVEVAILVARGYTNREIAGQLVIAQQTVATHVVHILAKLDVRSRAQVGAWAAAHGLLGAQ